MLSRAPCVLSVQRMQECWVFFVQAFVQSMLNTRGMVIVMLRFFCFKYKGERERERERETDRQTERDRQTECEREVRRE